MLSNPTTSNLRARQRQHRRQNSTPTVFDDAKIANLPNFPRQRQNHVSHRRGLSLDTRRQQLTHIAPSPNRQDPNTVSSPTNPGLATTPQHVLREAQQQRIARPGHAQPFATMADDETYLMSPHRTPQSQRFDASCFDRIPDQSNQMAMPYDAFNSPFNATIRANQAGFTNIMTSRDFELYGPDSALSTPTFLNFQDSPGASQGWISEGETSSTRRSSRRISNGILDRVAKFESMGSEGSQRPITPPNQNECSNYFPPTPMETPHDRMVKHEPERPSRFSEGHDESMEETLKPARSRTGKRAQDIFHEIRNQSAGMPIPPRANAMPSAGFDGPMPAQDFMNMNHFNTEFMKIETGFDGLDYAAEAIRSQSGMSQHASPATPAHASFAAAFDNKPDLQLAEFDSQSTATPISATQSPRNRSPSRRDSPHRRTESLASIASAASIASINIEETKTMTGVTLDEISAYIQGPSPEDGKWLCLYEECGKKFGRKENIKSHVQTHLNDRQYRCPTCKKCFVRQHDLKRHAKIHTGIKPYPCECGNSFARHDALTRHRQRGMCIGAFDGVVRKVVKRGRPRKHRPDMDERVDKSSRTRTRNKGATSTSSASSQSGYSDSSAVNSPQNDLDQLLDDQQFPDLMDVAMSDCDNQPASSPLISTSGLGVSSAPMPTLRAQVQPTISSVSVDQRSPSAMSPESYVSLAAVEEQGLPPRASSPARSVGSHYNQATSPPELSASSSPPPCGRFFDFEPNSSSTDGSVLGRGTVGAGSCCIGGGNLLLGAENSSANTSGLEDDMLLQAFTNEDGLVQLDRGGDATAMLMFGGSSNKFEDEYAMFTNGDDVFFGST